jgi:hypothetical protein
MIKKSWIKKLTGATFSNPTDEVSSAVKISGQKARH